jgi:2-isopropylmalate synthase
VAEATVKVVVGGERVVTTGEGNGPVNAIDRAVGRPSRTIPKVDELRLTDYRVRVLDSPTAPPPRSGSCSRPPTHEDSWGTIGVHENVIEASWEALMDGILVGLLRMGA